VHLGYLRVMFALEDPDAIPARFHRRGAGRVKEGGCHQGDGHPGLMVKN